MQGRLNTVVMRNTESGQWIRYRDPLHIIQTMDIHEVFSKLEAVEHTVQKQELHAVGFISYEAAPAFDRALQTYKLTSFPLLWFGLFDKFEVIEFPKSVSDSTDILFHWESSLTINEYHETLYKIRRLIEAGDTYQVNFTFRLHGSFDGDPWPIFVDLVHNQKEGYFTFINTPAFAICSISPELFFRLQGDLLISRPMKGTIGRGLTLPEDKKEANWLRRSEKNQAENVMIVDMIRNDMGKVAQPGSVHVNRLFELEKYPTLWQMTSTVQSTTKESVCEIIKALFPCGSVTGAPKVRTMQIIHELENTPRRVYTGCVGWMLPNRFAQFNVAIRTLLIDKDEDRAEYGIGGGIVWDSESDHEYHECFNKAEVLFKKQPEFSLLETLLWTEEEGYFLLDYHLERLKESAEYFDIPLLLDDVYKILQKMGQTFKSQRLRIRLLCTQEGIITVEKSEIEESNSVRPRQIKMALKPVDIKNPFIYHKTTYRRIYEEIKKSLKNCDDIILWNDRGEVTESTIANIVVQIENRLVTPPVSCGLLPGTFRAWLLDQKKITERIISIEEFKQNKEIYLINSVQKWCNAKLVH